MATDKDSLKELFLEYSEDGTVTEEQENGPSYEPVDEDAAEEAENAAAVATSAREGMADAIAQNSGPSKQSSADGDANEA